MKNKIYIDEEKLFYDCDVLYSMPETGFELSRTKEYVKKALRAMGVECKDTGKCGITATLGQGEKCVLLRADMDALELDGKGPFHGCGHHMHTAMLLGAARILKANENKLKNTVKLMFQPAEETLEGAVDMLASGVLHNPKPEAAFMLHVATATDFPAGTLIFPSEGEIAPAVEYFRIKIEGMGCHGAQPHMGYDPIIPACHIVTAFENINARELPSAENSVLTIGSIHGGNAANAIPTEVVISGTLRSYSMATIDFVKKRLLTITENICQAFRTKGTIAYTGGAPTFLCSGKVLNRAMDISEKVFGKEKIVNSSELKSNQKNAGSEDFAYVSHKIPTIMASLSAGSKQDGYVYPLHHPEVRFDKKALPAGSTFLAYMGMEY